MRWRIKVYKGPHLGDIRIKKCFALFPVKIGGFVAWLEAYQAVERCYHVYGWPFGAKWVVEHKAFQREECFHFLSAHFESYPYVSSQKLFRHLPGSGPASPWDLG